MIDDTMTYLVLYIHKIVFVFSAFPLFMYVDRNSIDYLYLSSYF